MMAALDIIRAANLTPTEHLLLENFIHEAVDRARAAAYLESKLKQNSTDDVETCLRRFKVEWRQLAMRGMFLGITNRASDLASADHLQCPVRMQYLSAWNAWCTPGVRIARGWTNPNRQNHSPLRRERLRLCFHRPCLIA